MTSPAIRGVCSPGAQARTHRRTAMTRTKLAVAMALAVGIVAGAAVTEVIVEKGKPLAEPVK